MRIQRIKLAGFRGIRTDIEIQVPGSFLVLAGANGSGKTTFCDGIEYLLCGNIRSGSQAQEGGESSNDYIWWRGSGDVNQRFVEIDFLNTNHKTVSYRRDPKGLTGTDNSRIENVMCDPLQAPEECLTQLTRTTILRAEELTKQSIDLTERERFEFAQSAVGVGDLSEPGTRAKALQELAESELNSLSSHYEQLRTRISDLTSQVAVAKSEAAGAGDSHIAERSLRQTLQDYSSAVSSLIVNAQSTVAAHRIRMDAISRLLVSLEEIQKEYGRTESMNVDLHALEQELALLRSSETRIRESLDRIAASVASQEKAKPLFTSLADLVSRGRQLGLTDSRCPLCGSEISEPAFTGHLLAVEGRVKEALTGLTQSLAERSGLEAELASIQSRFAVVENRRTQIVQSLAMITSKVERVRQDARDLGLLVDEGLPTVEGLREEGERLRQIANVLEESCASLEASKIYDQIQDLEHELRLKQSDALMIEKEMAVAEAVIDRAKRTSNTIRRIEGELVDERLAEISPLLAELYGRLRPHADWRDITYKLRGDVRKFLRLTVGQEWNPNFMFSSGQRRALALAFLLAIHLSRPWAKLNSLVLDDPVQHIDDYRALHFVEVLSALRMTGRQVICTVEDPALAQLLCRRLRSPREDPGRLVELEYVQGDGVHVVSQSLISPMYKNVLLAS